MMLDSRFMMHDSRYTMLDAQFSMQDARCWIEEELMEGVEQREFSL